MHKKTPNVASFMLMAFGFDSQNLGEISVLLLSQTTGQIRHLNFITWIFQPNHIMKPAGVSSK